MLRLILPLALVATCGMLWSQAPAWQADPKVEKELVEVEHRWAEALVKNDPSMIQDRLAEEYILLLPYVHSNREHDLHGGSFNGDWKAQECHFVPTEIRVYGDTALVIGKYDQKATYKGAPADEKGVFTDVFVKRNGKWLCVLGQSTPNGI